MTLILILVIIATTAALYHFYPSFFVRLGLPSIHLPSIHLPKIP